MRKLPIAASIAVALASSSASAQWLGGLAAAGDSLAKGIDKWSAVESQKELMLLQHKLEMERIDKIASIRGRTAGSQNDSYQQDSGMQPQGPTQLQNNLAVEAEFPKWLDILGSTSFATWSANQRKFPNLKPMEVYILANSRPDAAITVLREYASDISSQSPANQAISTPTYTQNNRSVAQAFPSWISILESKSYADWASRQKKFPDARPLTVYNMANTKPEYAIAILQQYTYGDK